MTTFICEISAIRNMQYDLDRISKRIENINKE